MLTLFFFFRARSCSSGEGHCCEWVWAPQEENRGFNGGLRAREEREIWDQSELNNQSPLLPSIYNNMTSTSFSEFAVRVEWAAESAGRLLLLSGCSQLYSIVASLTEGGLYSLNTQWGESSTWHVTCTLDKKIAAILLWCKCQYYLFSLSKILCHFNFFVLLFFSLKWMSFSSWSPAHCRATTPPTLMDYQGRLVKRLSLSSHCVESSQVSNCPIIVALLISNSSSIYRTLKWTPDPCNYDFFLYRYWCISIWKGLFID